MTPYLNFSGQCEEAFTFYAQCLGGTVGALFQIKDTSEAERVFRELSRDGRVLMALEQTFWAARFGMVVDRFGIPWLINCERVDAPAAE